MHSYDNTSRRLKSASTKFAPDINHLRSCAGVVAFACVIEIGLLKTCLSGWVRLPSICVIIGADGYAYPVFVLYDHPVAIMEFPLCRGGDEIGNKSQGYRELGQGKYQGMGSNGGEEGAKRYVETRVRPMGLHTDFAAIILLSSTCRTSIPAMLAPECSKNGNPVNARNPTVRACYECGSTTTMSGQLVPKE
ncbi:hypothetical protein Tco_0637303 [Tanacetum coccineum]